MMAFSEAIDSLFARIHATEPRFDADIGFASLEDPESGYVVAVEDIPDPVSRYFDLRLTSLPEDAAKSGYGLSRFKVGLVLRVRYMPHPRARAERQIASDIPLLINALVHPAIPLPWHSSIDTIEPPGRPELQEMRGPETVAALILRLPFVLHYYDPQEQ